MPNTWYLKNPQTVKNWAFNLTTVDFREKQQAERIAETIEMAEGRKPFPVVKSNEEAVDLIKAIIGYGRIVSNVNMPNLGQMPQMPRGAIVETNCVFADNTLKPVIAGELPPAVLALVMRNHLNIESCYNGIKHRDLDEIFASFVNQPLCSTLTVDEAHSLFKKMCLNTRGYLDDYFDLDGYFKD